MLHIILLIDRSHSMITYTQKVINGINNFLVKLKQIQCYFSLVFFNDDRHYHYWHMPVNEIQFIKDKEYNPYGMTALYDSIDDILNNGDDEKDSNVLFIITDGEDTMSKHTTKDDVYNKMLKYKTWLLNHLVFLSAQISSLLIYRQRTVKIIPPNPSRRQKLWLSPFPVTTALTPKPPGRF